MLSINTPNGHSALAASSTISKALKSKLDSASHGLCICRKVNVDFCQLLIVAEHCRVPAERGRERERQGEELPECESVSRPDSSRTSGAESTIKLSLVLLDSSMRRGQWTTPPLQLPPDLLNLFSVHS